MKRNGVVCSGGSKGGAQGMSPPPGPNSFNFMQFSGKYIKIICWRPPGELAPPPGGNPGSATGLYFHLNPTPWNLRCFSHKMYTTEPTYQLINTFFLNIDRNWIRTSPLHWNFRHHQKIWMQIVTDFIEGFSLLYGSSFYRTSCTDSVNRSTPGWKPTRVYHRGGFRIRNFVQTHRK